MKKGAVTFLLPGNNRSGGVRVTALMGNLLLERGYQYGSFTRKRGFLPWQTLLRWLQALSTP